MSFELNVVKRQESSGILGRNVDINRTQMSFELMSSKGKNLVVFRAEMLKLIERKCRSS